MTLLQATTVMWKTDILLCKTDWLSLNESSIVRWMSLCYSLWAQHLSDVCWLGNHSWENNHFTSLAMTHSCGAAKFIILTRVLFGVTCLWLHSAINGWCPRYTFDIVTKQQIFVICCFWNHVDLSMGNGGNSKRMLFENSHQIASAVNGIRRSLDWIWRLI